MLLSLAFLSLSVDGEEEEEEGQKDWREGKDKKKGSRKRRLSTGMLIVNDEAGTPVTRQKKRQRERKTAREN